MSNMVDEPRPPDTHEGVEGPDGRPERPLVQYERTDASHRWIIGLFGAAVVLGVLILGGIWLFYARYRDYQAEVKKSNFPLSPAPSPTLPPEPRLEQLDRLSGSKSSGAVEVVVPREAALNTYGPTAEEGFVRIPIDRAMQVLEDRLPVRAEAPEDHGKGNGLVAAGEPNSGRVFRRSPR
jgi:hypothetical protein